MRNCLLSPSWQRISWKCLYIRDMSRKSSFEILTKFKRKLRFKVALDILEDAAFGLGHGP